MSRGKMVQELGLKSRPGLDLKQQDVDVLEIVGVPLVFSSLSMGTEVKD
jgi:hypothetical protein